MDLVIQTPASRQAERTYICRLLVEEFLGLSCELRTHPGPDTVILCPAVGRGRITVCDRFFGVDERVWLQPSSLPQRPLAWWTPPVEWSQGGAEALPVIYGEPVEGTYLVKNGDNLRVGIDIFGSAFFMLSRYEECVRPERDHHGRFPAAASIAGAEGFLERPVINEYLDLLWHALAAQWPTLKRRSRAYRFLPSHDVDDISLLGRSWPSVVRSLGVDLLVRREPRLAWCRFTTFRETRRTGRPASGEPYDKFDFFMDASERCGVKSTFNFIADRIHPTIDPRYDIGDAAVRSLLRKIRDRGHIVGLHPSFYTYRDPVQLRREFEALLRVCREEGVQQATWGGRQHYLRWENPITWRLWNEAGLEYDSSLAFAEAPGFRTGFCYEYPVWDLLQGCRLRLTERPLIAMENSFLSYQGMTPERAGASMIALAQRCRRHHGDFTLLWHNHLLASAKLQEIYRRVVAEVA